MNNNQLLNLIALIERTIDSLGIMYRIFYREKSLYSLESKIKNNPGKYNCMKKIQDIVGVRIALYFIDDIEILKNALVKKFIFIEKDSQIDKPAIETFSAIRCNLIFKLPDSYNFSSFVPESLLEVIDDTFELQIRTVLSEGWHEVDHDLRYKCKSDWVGLDKENRAFNGVYATLETSEWTLLKLFDELAYTHYKNKNIKAMLINKFRLKLKPSAKDDEVIHYLINNPKLIKPMYRYEREKMILNLSLRPKLPLNLANLVFIMNLDSINDIGLSEHMPSLLQSWWNSRA
ncbi:RelA/SpoT domain-containing protein [Klebsiella variicola]|uniref:RelA/SpoT domain-containing protein n=1 Tax=Klebsiella variicola TaxID=244366 RepID=UPI002AB93BBC|nr:RelA/SpoT domain-containing protein [Klebsiella variicola]MDZ2608968.1 RelA/SpoT domain-containing protein [Klebsiella variicola]